MFYKAGLGLVFAAAAFSLGAAGPAPLNADDRDRMDLACAEIATHEQAQSCLEPFYEASMLAAGRIWRDLHAGGRVPDRGSMTPEQKIHYPETFAQACQTGWQAGYREGQSPESYLGPSSWCLAFAAQLADQNRVSYDAENVEWLLARQRRLRHLDLSGLK